MGIEDIASVVEHDVTVDSVFDALPKVGTVDVITMSYSFSMIPDQAGVLRNATKLLKKGGYLALVRSYSHIRLCYHSNPCYVTNNV